MGKKRPADKNQHLISKFFKKQQEPETGEEDKENDTEESVEVTIAGTVHGIAGLIGK